MLLLYLNCGPNGTVPSLAQRTLWRDPFCAVAFARGSLIRQWSKALISYKTVEPLVL
jgi:hypothetical protein